MHSEGARVTDREAGPRRSGGAARQDVSTANVQAEVQNGPVPD